MINEDESVWETKVREFLDQREGQRVTTKQVMVGALGMNIDNLERCAAIRVGHILSRLGWVMRRDTNPPRDWYYCRP